MNIELQPETIGILKDDYQLSDGQIGYIKRHLNKYESIPDEYLDSTILVCGDAYSEALNFNEQFKDDIKRRTKRPIGIAKNMDKSIEQYYQDLNCDIPKKLK